MLYPINIKNISRVKVTDEMKKVIGELRALFTTIFIGEICE